MGHQPVIAQAIYQILGADCEVLTAADGPTTFALCNETLPDLVLLDDETLKFQSEQLHTMAFRDTLTGVYARHYFDERIGVECALARRSGSVLSLFVIEIDHFNAYNDYYGYQAGDDALRLIARVLESRLHRPGDLIARYGCEAFVCLLPATDFEPSTQLAGKIERAVRARGIGHASSAAAPVVTVSVGVATSRRAIEDGSEALLRLADDQLCQAKQRGGGRVCGKVLYRP
ncbi:diguanylate cyclase [uncultured Lamprocystis sp.]|uniref:diguanylate cyclase n=1 Tax=uncultured Lamprocystis sp. TaxID=543132 RepID=UPI0025E3F7AB|nr:diguanylate cyclase [uncultured Lamprocystis sp.]